MSGIETGVELIIQSLFNTNFAGQNWLMMLIVIMGTLIIITRVPKDWATLTLPVMVGWEYFGVNIPYTFYTIGVIIFVINVLSLKVISGALSGIGEALGGTLAGKGRLLSRRTRVESKIKGLELKRQMKVHESLLQSARDKGELKDKEYKKQEKIRKKIEELMKKKQKEGRVKKIVDTWGEKYE